MKTRITLLLLTIATGLGAQTLSPQLLKNVNDDSGFTTASNPGNWVASGNNVFFWAADDGLNGNAFFTDGTEGGTHSAAVTDYTGTFKTGFSGIPLNGGMIMQNHIDSNMYFNDGTADNDVQLLSSLQGYFAYPFNHKNSFEIGGKAFFWADVNGSGVGAELYETDGTASGTKLFYETAPGMNYGAVGGGTVPHAIQATANKAFFIASDSDSVGVYVTDGTVNGTSLIGNYIQDGIIADMSFYPVIINGYVIALTLNQIHSFKISDNSHIELGNTGGLALYIGMYHIEDKLFWLEQDGAKNVDFMSTDGATVTTIADNKWVRNGNISPHRYSTNQTAADGKFFFIHHPAILENVQLWVSDGTDAGTVKVADSIAVSGQGVDFWYTCNDRTFYYQAGAAKTLWEIDMDDYSIDLAADLSTITVPSVFINESNCTMYFPFDAGAQGIEPHTVDLGGGSIPGSIKKLDNSSFNVYPNPSNGILNVDNPNKEQTEYRLHNLLGVQLATYSLHSGLNQISLNVKPGLYLLQSETSTRKIIVH